MKILYVDQTGQLGGGELALLHWLRYASKDAVTVLLEDGPLRLLLEEIGLHVELLPLKSLRGIRRESGILSIIPTLPEYFRIRMRLAKLASTCDLIYANSQKAFLLACLAKRRNQPLVWHLRDILNEEHFSYINRKVAVAAGNHFATIILANSHATAESFIASGGDPKKVKVIHNGVSEIPFDAVESSVASLLRKEIAPEAKLLVGLFGRLSPWKGQHILLDAIRSIPDAHAVLVGDSLFGEDSYAAEIKTMANAPELSGRVHFLGFRKDIPALMKSMDIIAHTSTAAEPFGRVIVEGMLAQKPVIATRAGGAIEILQDKENGLLVTPGSVEELRDAILYLRDNPIAAEKLAQRGRERAISSFSLDAYFSNVTAVLERYNPQLTVSEEISVSAHSTSAQEIQREETSDIACVDKPMKVLYIDQTGQLGGGELALLHWLRYASKEARVVLLEDGPFKALIEECGIPVDILPLRALKDVRRESGLASIIPTLPMFFRLRSRLAVMANDYDVLYANSQKAFMLAALAKKRHQPLIWHLRDILTEEHFSNVNRKIAAIFGNLFATTIIANSHATAASYIASGGRPNKVRVVHEGVCPDAFDRVDPESCVRMRNTIAPNAKSLVGLFGRLSPWKGQHILIDAIRTLPDVHAVLVGDSLFGEDIYAQQLRSMANLPELAGRVHFLGFRSDVPELMKSMDIIVHTSTAPEPFGMVIIEGMLAKRPVIATRAGGAVELLKNGETGLLVTPSAVEELRDAILLLVADPTNSERMALNGRKKAEEAFSLRDHLRQIHTILHASQPEPHC